MDRCFAESRRRRRHLRAHRPGSANAIGGQFIAMKTAGRRIDDLCVRFPGCMKFALGENPKMTYGEKRETPMTRMATAALIREELYKAREYMDKRARAKPIPTPTRRTTTPSWRPWSPVLRREVPAHFHAHRADDMLTAIRIAREFDLDYVLVHGTEGHLIADILAAEGARVICGPLLTDRSKPELSHQTIENPARLARAGIPLAICRPSGAAHPVSAPVRRHGGARRTGQDGSTARHYH